MAKKKNKEELVEAKKAEVKTCIIRGKGEITRDFFYEYLKKYDGAELWTINEDFDSERSVRHFDMHWPRNHFGGKREGHRCDYGQYGVEFSGKKLVEVISPKNYPVKEVEERLGARVVQFVNNGMSWMVLFAVLMGYKRICLCGVDFGMDEIRQGQLLCLEGFLRVAESVGIEVVVPDGHLLYCRKEMYGFPLDWKEKGLGRAGELAY